MSTYIRLLKYLRTHARLFLVAIGCMLVSTLLQGVQLGAIFPLADRILTDKRIPEATWLPGWLQSLVAWFNSASQHNLVVWLAFAIPPMFLLKGLFDFLQSFYMNDVAQRIIRDLRQALFDRLITLSVDYHNKSTVGTLMSRILYDTSIIQNSITEGCTDLFFQSFQAAMLLGFAVAANWKLALAVFLIVPLIAFPVARLGSLLKKLSHQSQVAMGQLNTAIQESLSGVRVVQAFLAEPMVLKKFAQANQQSYRVLRKLQKRMNALAPLTECIGAVFGAAFFWYGGQQVLSGTMSLGAFFFFLGSVLSLFRPFKRLARLHGINQQALASAERIFEVLDTPSSVVEHPQARHLAPFTNEITYEHVSMHYDNKPALRDLSLTVRRNECVAFVGPSGGGKTTLVNLLPRFYDPISGRVKIDGTDIRTSTLSSLRTQIGMVTQETFLFNDSIRANIALGKPDAAFAEIVEAAKLANAHDFISRLRQGYDTVVGERGGQLSGGERQRIAIARAFLKNPAVLILDEATSQLDAESEHLISEALDRLTHGRTVLLIAHRLSSVRLAHRIVVIQEGRIIEQGTHDELLRKSPLYRRFCELQLIQAGGERPSSGE